MVTHKLELLSQGLLWQDSEVFTEGELSQNGRSHTVMGHNQSHQFSSKLIHLIKCTKLPHFMLQAIRTCMVSLSSYYCIQVSVRLCLLTPMCGNVHSPAREI